MVIKPLKTESHSINPLWKSEYFPINKKAIPSMDQKAMNAIHLFSSFFLVKYSFPFIIMVKRKESNTTRRYTVHVNPNVAYLMPISGIMEKAVRQTAIKFPPDILLGFIHPIL